MAKKLIGATWDVGHIHMLRKYGYTEKEIVEEAKKIASHYQMPLHTIEKAGHINTDSGYGKWELIEELVMRNEK